MKLTLTNKDLELISEVMHTYKDINRGNTEEILRVMDFEKELAKKTCDAYKADTTYNVNIKRVKAVDIDWETDGYCVKLPNEVIIPPHIDVEDEFAISDYLSDEYGFLHNGFNIVEI